MGKGPLCRQGLLMDQGLREIRAWEGGPGALADRPMTRTVGLSTKRKGPFTLRYNF